MKFTLTHIILLPLLTSCRPVHSTPRLSPDPSANPPQGLTSPVAAPAPGSIPVSPVPPTTLTNAIIVPLQYTGPIQPNGPAITLNGTAQVGPPPPFRCPFTATKPQPPPPRKSTRKSRPSTPPSTPLTSQPPPPTPLPRASLPATSSPPGATPPASAPPAAKQHKTTSSTYPHSRAAAGCKPGRACARGWRARRAGGSFCATM